MIKVTSLRDLTYLRRLSLQAQGLLQSQPFGQGVAGACNAINHLGYVQIDTLSVVERAHHHVLHSRVPKFKQAMVNQMLVSRDIFEYWSHAAAFLPIADFRFSLPYKQAVKSGQTHWYKTPDRKLMKELLARIRSDGPLRSRDLAASRPNNTGWWDFKPAKKALEQLYMEGDLMVSSREGFQKIYDLTERVLPADTSCETPDMTEFATHLVEQQLRCHGFSSLKGMTYLRRNLGLRKAVKAVVDERVAQGELEQLQLENGHIFLIEAGALERRLPRLSNRLLILSPFDNAVIQRERLKALFGFDYQIECYLPAAKRQYGYFSLPLLYRDQFIGRMDCKAHRKTRHLEIKSLHFEPCYLDGLHVDEAEMIEAFKAAVMGFCQFQGCDTVSLANVNTRNLAQRLRNALKPLTSARVAN